MSLQHANVLQTGRGLVDAGWYFFGTGWHFFSSATPVRQDVTHQQQSSHATGGGISSQRMTVLVKLLGCWRMMVLTTF